MNPARRFRAGLTAVALIAFASFGRAQTANANEASLVNTQTAEVEALLTAAHDLASYNGNPQTAFDHLASFSELWAEDATLVVNGGTPIEGHDKIIAFFAINPLFNANFVGLTPSSRTKILIHGDTAEVYLECIFLKQNLDVSPPTLAVGPQRSLSGTVRKVDGKWLFWRMANNPAQPLFP